jgi:hypothetical protein
VSIRYAVVHSPCGNVIHTLINTRDYKDKVGLPFLPGFQDVEGKPRSLGMPPLTKMVLKTAF